jgi:3-methylfumaryl-CoA hydratase
VNPIVREEVLTFGPVEALAGLLDIDVPDSENVPVLWHWVYLLDRRPTHDLGPDGHPTIGIPAPPEPGMSRMFAGGRVNIRRQLRIGSRATRTTWIASEVEKQGRNGPLRFATVHHEIWQDGLAIVEDQDIVYREPVAGQVHLPGEGLPKRTPALTIDVDERLLFRFSALTYNAHRIHYDRSWCLQEGYADLVVHGPLQALLMGELARRNDLPLTGHCFDYRLLTPMIGPQAMHVLPSDEGLGAGMEVRTADGRLTATATVHEIAEPDIGPS